MSSYDTMQKLSSLLVAVTVPAVIVGWSPLNGPGVAEGWHQKYKGSISKTVNRNANGALPGPLTFVWNVSMLLDIGL